MSSGRSPRPARSFPPSRPSSGSASRTAPGRQRSSCRSGWRDGTRILVDRGYFSTNDLAAGRLPADLPTGRVTVIGRVSADQPDPSNRPGQTTQGRREVYGIDSAVLLGADPGARLGFVQLVDASPGVLAEIGVPDRDGGPFLSYALQWAVFGGVALLAAGFFAYREVTDPLGAATDPLGDSDGGSVTAGPPHTGTAAEPDVAPTAAAGPAKPAKPQKVKFDKSQLYD